MRKSYIHNDCGSVMLETILVLPVYLVFIATVFFVGELSLYRNLLVQLDQYDLWNIGNRANSLSKHNDVLSVLFGTTGQRDFAGDLEIGDMEKDERVLSANNWWQKNSLRNTATLKMPSWVKNIRFISGSTIDNKDLYTFSSGEKKVLFSRYDNNSWRNAAESGSALCEQTNSKASPEWVNIVNENYVGNDGGVGVSGNFISEYTRKTSAYGIFTGETQK